MSIPAEVAFDRAALVSRLEGDEELVQEIVALFIEDGAVQVDKLRAAVAAAALEEAARIAHTVKGAAANVSAEAIRGLSHRVEAAAREGHAEQAGPLVDRIEHELDRLRQALGAS